MAAAQCPSTVTTGDGVSHTCDVSTVDSRCFIPCEDGTSAIFTCTSGAGSVGGGDYWAETEACATGSASGGDPSVTTTGGGVDPGTGASGTTGSDVGTTGSDVVGCDLRLADSAGNYHECANHAIGDVCETPCAGLVDASAAYTCTDGGWSPYRTCGSSSTGTGEVPVCHGVVEVSFYARAECGSTDVGSVCTVGCREGYTGTSTAYVCTAYHTGAKWMPEGDAIACHSDIACDPGCGENGVCKASLDGVAACHCNSGWTGVSCDHNTFVTGTIALDGFDCSTFVLTDDLVNAYVADVKSNLVAVYNAEYGTDISGDAFDVSEVHATCADGTVSFTARITPVEGDISVEVTVAVLHASIDGTSSAGTFTATSTSAEAGASLSLNSEESGAVVVDNAQVAVSAASAAAPAVVVALFAVVASLF